MSIGGHHNPISQSNVWLTPPGVLEALGGPESFDLDPCAAPHPQPYPTALRMNAESDADGLRIEWDGRVWLNPPYSANVIAQWLARMAHHDHGTALIFARTETAAFRRYVWERAAGLLFLYGRLNFHHPDGTRATKNSGAPSVLCAYGQDDLERLAASGLPGALTPLRFARYLLIDGLVGTWGEEVRAWLADQPGPINLSDAYRHFARHPKSWRNRHWRAKVRQQLQEHGRRVGRGRYVDPGPAPRFAGI